MNVAIIVVFPHHYSLTVDLSLNFTVLNDN